ncbi:uncharacterized protein DUF1905 [Glaciihabitans tibetensis]|uniref:Uncharacterized protein DUF1905 n=1 Tax=Glaciihabitans tibetensis TaxID=1266600 RepID=A0A2T0VIG0_9MICO|nr:DUF1905 domain-containing protein [Glaciihabitans tibetensis]PRY69998.1 uncharacterized protein DUF1905 [Glaciihabitans tibetensis]
MDDRRTRFSFIAELWEWTSRTSWYFVSVPTDQSAEIEDQPRPPRGFGSVKVRVRVGASRWETSIFPSSGTSSVASPESALRGSAVREYVLPIKKSVRSAEGIAVTDRVSVELELLE